MIQDVQNMVGLGLSVANLVGSLSQGLQFGDIAKVVSIIKQVGPVLHGASAAFAEYENMSDADAQGLEQYVQDNFNIPNQAVETAIKGALKVAIELHEIVKMIVPVPPPVANA